MQRFCCGFSGEIDTHAELHSLGWSLTYSAIPQAFHSYYFMAIKISKIPFIEWISEFVRIFVST
jgi:hypothetical protein